MEPTNQPQAFSAAAATMKDHRYETPATPEATLETLRALAEVLTEVAYHLDANQVLEPKAMQAYRDAATTPMTTLARTSAETILTFPLQARIDELIARLDAEEQAGQ